MCIRDRADGGQRGGRFIPRRGWSEEPPRHPKTKERGFRRPSPEGGISPPVVHREAERPRLLPSLRFTLWYSCLLYTSDAADERSSVDLGGRRIIKKKKYWLLCTS